jgi:hypothetical protein
MRKSNQQSISSLLEQFISDNKLQGGLTQVELNAAWPEIVGTFIAKHSVELKIIRQTLIVTIDNAACREELAYRKTEVLQRVNTLSKNLIIQEMIIR